MFFIVSSIPPDLGFCSFQITHASCCPFLIRVPPIMVMGGYPGRCPCTVRVLPIMVMGGHPGRCPCIVRVFPIMITGRHPGRCPFLIKVLPPSTGPHRPTFTGTKPLRFCSTFRPTTLFQKVVSTSATFSSNGDNCATPWTQSKLREVILDQV